MTNATPLRLWESRGRRERIVEAARSALRESDFSTMSMADVAHRAGLARPNLYRYFNSKDDLLKEVLLKEVQAIHAIRRRRLAGIESIRERIVASVVIGAEQTSKGEVLPSIAGPLLDGVPALMSGDFDLMNLEIEYWMPILEQARAENIVIDHLSDARIIRWFMVCQYLMATQKALVADGIRAFVEDFVVGAVLRPSSPTV